MYVKSMQNAMRRVLITTDAMESVLERVGRESANVISWAKS